MLPVNNHRIVAGTKRARQGMAQTGHIVTTDTSSSEMRAWNAKVEADKAARRKRKNKSHKKARRDQAQGT